MNKRKAKVERKLLLSLRFFGRAIVDSYEKEASLSREVIDFKRVDAEYEQFVKEGIEP